MEVHGLYELKSASWGSGLEFTVLHPQLHLLQASSISIKGRERATERENMKEKLVHT